MHERKARVSRQEYVSTLLRAQRAVKQGGTADNQFIRP